VRAVERAVDILFSFSAQAPVQDIAGLQKNTGLSRPTLYRLLGTLERKGLVHSFGEPRRFQLGYRCALLSSAWNHSPALLSVARERLEALWRETQETVTLMVPLSNTHRMCVIELKSPQPISFSRGTGYVEPMHRGASGKVLLAQMSPPRLDDALASLPAREKTRLMAEVAAARGRRSLVTRGEVIPGAVAIAAPVLVEGREPVGSVCVFATELRMLPETIRRCERAVSVAAADIAQRVAQL
jgi:DNA-binding IclR family transcriptional regulator